MPDMLCEVTDLKQWSYCPRVVFYRYCMPDVRPVTALMQSGIERHREEATREERRSLRTYGLADGERHYDLALRSEALGLSGRLDLAIATPGQTIPGAEAVVVEYKDSEDVLRPHFALQLAAYALLLEEAWGMPVQRGFLYSIPLRKAEPVAIARGLREKARQAAQAMRAAIDGEQTPPPPKRRSPCVSCEFRRFCNDVV